jgi:maleylacetate reductase
VTRLIRIGPGSIAGLGELLDEIGVRRALLVTSRRGAAAANQRRLPVAGVFEGVRPHVPVETVRAATALAREAGADGLVGFGGGAAIDTSKAVAATVLHEMDAAGQPGVMPVVAVPTTYAGAEWTSFFGMLLEPGRKGGGSDARAAPIAAVYDAELTLELPVPDTVGTTMNALAHCAEAYYHPATNDVAASQADHGARAIAEALQRVVAHPASLADRSRLLEGAMHAAVALAESGLCLAHAMAQGLGGRYGLPQGTMNALCLPAALRFNAPTVPDAVERLGRALGGEADSRCEELAALGDFGRLRDHGVPEPELASVAEEIAARPGARANPRPAAAGDVELLLREIW